MSIHYLNCFTTSARIPRHWQSGTLCLLVESTDGLILVDTGLGIRNYSEPPPILRVFKRLVISTLDPQEAALSRVTELGYQPEDVRHIVLTHLHFDHAGGLSDFPWAAVHLHRREFQTFNSMFSFRWKDMGYNRRVFDHQPGIHLYQESGEKWYDFDSILLPFEPEMWLIPLHGHSAGHCGVAIEEGDGWLFHVGDTVSFADDAPDWLVKFVLGPHQPRLKAFDAAHPEVRMTMGHMDLKFFSKNTD